MSLPHAILVIVAEQAHSGYDLAKRFDGSLGFFWKSTHQQIYRELHKLEEQGWIAGEEVAQTGRPDKKLFAITGAGREELQHWISQPCDLAAIKDEFLVRISGGYLVEPEIIRKQIDQHLRLHQAKLATYQEIEQKLFSDKRSLPKDVQFSYLTLRRGILYETEWINWCQEAAEILAISC